MLFPAGRPAFGAGRSGRARPSAEAQLAQDVAKALRSFSALLLSQTCPIVFWYDWVMPALLRQGTLQGLAQDDHQTMPCC